MTELTENAKTLLAKRYLREGESADQMFRRVAKACSEAEEAGARDEWGELFYNLMSSLKFLPNSPTLMNAGYSGTLSACFTFHVGDSMDEIFEVGRLAGAVLKYGGGVGYGLSRLRPKGAHVASTNGKARGPLAAMAYYQSIAAFVEQGGKRDGAQMAILSADHPDLIDFIHSKDRDPQRFNTFNISVSASDEWMRENKNSPLMREIAQSAWETGDPGFYFHDAAERDNPTPWLGKLESTNPCGEVPLLHAEACNLGSFNLSAYAYAEVFTHKPQININELQHDISTAVRMLDNVITINQFPDPLIANAVAATRKIGIGVMGWADLLAISGVPYDSEYAVDWGGRLGMMIREEADMASVRLARERGSYPAHREDVPGRRQGQIMPFMRNATRLCIAPTGSIALIAGCSSGIEPHYALEYTRIMGDGTKLPTREPVLEQLTDGFIPKTAMEIAPKWHLAHQAAWQSNVDLAVSKTINLRNDATVEDVYEAYVSAWEQGCKGVTVFRDGCRSGGEQVLNVDGPLVQVTPLMDGRKRLPVTGPAIRHKFEVGGVQGYIHVGLFDDTKPGEVFLTINREGSSVRGWADLTSTLFSIALQRGVPLEELTAKLRHARFEPSGMTDNPDIPLATSIPDYLGHFLEEHFLADDGRTIGYIDNGMHCPECGNGTKMQEGCMNCPSCGWERCG